MTPENNAWIPVLRGFDSGDLDDNDRARHNKSLGIPLQSLQPGAFQGFGSSTFRKQVPDAILVASSAAAQAPWYVETLRLSAYNVAKRAQRTSDLDGVSSGEVPADDRPIGIQIVDAANSTIAASAETIAELAGDPEAALARYALESIDVIEPLEGAEIIPDLREATLRANQPPELITPGQTLAWRKEQISNARDKLFEREEKIIAERPWSRAECPLAAYWLDTQSAALDRLISEMAARPKFYAPYLTAAGHPEDEIAFGILLPGVQMMRTLSEALQHRAYNALQRGDLAAAIRDFETQLRISALHPANPFLVDTLVALSLHGSAMKTLAEIVANSQVTDAQLAALVQLMEQTYAFPNYLQSMETDRISIVDFIVAIGARGKNPKVMPGMDQQAIAFVVICWDDVLRRVNELFDRAAVAIKNKDWPAMQQLGQEVEVSPADLPRLSILPSQRTAIAKFVLPRLLMGSAFSAYHLALKAEVQHDAARVMLALERFRRANMTYPAALTELVPAYLPSVPNDPFDGKPLKYFRTAAGGYRAYSIGANGVDDDGNPGLSPDGEVDVHRNDLVIGSPDEIPRRINLGW
jgi:hypothetical protein